MNIVDKNIKTIFRYDGQYGTKYSIGLSRKDKEGKYINGYMPCRFKGEADIQNKTSIYIKDAWLSFNVKDNKTYPFIFINEYETVGERIEQAKEEAKDPFEDFNNEYSEEINNSDLPF